MDMSRPQEIEPLSNRFLIHRLSAALLPPAIRIGVHPNLVTLLGLGFGLLAAVAYGRAGGMSVDGPGNWRWATLGLLLMLAWLVMDGLDGQLARATGKSSDIGRLLDGVADYASFIAVNLALVFTYPNPWIILVLALTAGAFHALQSQFYEGERATYIRRLKGQFEAVRRPEAGGPFERFYNRCEALLGNRARPFDHCLAAADSAQQQRLLAAWKIRAAPTLLSMSPLSSNGRVFALWVAVVAGETRLYWLWEIVALTLFALAAAHKLRQAEAAAMAGETCGGQAPGNTDAIADTGAEQAHANRGS